VAAGLAGEAAISRGRFTPRDLVLATPQAVTAAGGQHETPRDYDACNLRDDMQLSGALAARESRSVTRKKSSTRIHPGGNTSREAPFPLAFPL
jgi:hypothetical protein